MSEIYKKIFDGLFSNKTKDIWRSALNSLIANTDQQTDPKVCI